MEIHILIFPAGLLPDFSYCAHWGHHHPFGINAARCLSNDADHRLGSQFLRALSARDHDCCCPVVHSGRITGGDGLVILSGWALRTLKDNPWFLAPHSDDMQNNLRFGLPPETKPDGEKLLLGLASFSFRTG